MTTSRPITTASPKTSASPATRRPSGAGSRRQGLSDAAAEGVPARHDLQRRVQGARHSAGADADCPSTASSTKAARPARIAAGAMPAAPSVRAPRRWWAICATRASAAPSCGRSATSRACSPTRAATASPASNTTTASASSTCSRRRAVVLAAYSAENPRIMLNSATDKHPKGLANQQRAGRQVSDVPPRFDRLGDVRRGRRRTTWAPPPISSCRTSSTTRRRQERLRQHLHSDRLGV